MIYVQSFSLMPCEVSSTHKILDRVDNVWQSISVLHENLAGFLTIKLNLILKILRVKLQKITVPKF